VHENENLNPDGTKKVSDRALGDEWADWVGDLSGYEKEINEGLSLFISVYFGALFTLTIFSFGVFYLIAPRLDSWLSGLSEIIMWVMAGVFVLLYLYALLLLLTVATGKNFLLIKTKEGLHVEWIYPLVNKVAGLFKISKDRVGHSITKVNNALVFATKKKFTAKNLLVLLPRCLSRETREQAMALSAKYGIKVFTATGGSSARQMVKKERPDAIIGVACERDLVSGMADSPAKIPVIGIANKRPEGPCKNTSIDIAELEKAVLFFLKKG
jgi:uncharacterized protein